MRFWLQAWPCSSRLTLGIAVFPPQEPAARNWLYAHTQNFYDEMSLNSIGAHV
jgi:hypothetical protein